MEPSTRIDNAKITCSRVIVAGDFNVHNTAWLGSTRTTVAGEAAEDLCYLHGLEQHVQEPTRGKNLLDLIMSDMDGNISTSIHQPLGKSDHATVVADFDQLPLREPPSSRTVWRYQRADWCRLRAFFRQCNWPNIISDDVNQSCTALSDIIKSGMTRFIPNKTLKTKLTDPAWWSPECPSAIKKKGKAWRLHRHNPLSADLERAYKTSTLAATSVVQRAKDAHNLSIRRKINSGTLSSRQWRSTIKRISGCGRHQEIPILTGLDGREHTSSRDKAECFANFFSGKCSLDSDFSGEAFPDVRARSTARLHIVHFRPDVVHRELKKIQPSKSTGSDMIPGRVLKECCRELSEPVARLFTMSFRQGRQPDLWKIASVVPVFKKKSKSNVRNYRPISLLPILSKVMETLVNRAVTNFLERNSILSSNQYGFRRGMSTQDILTLLSHRWHTTSARGGSTRVLAVDVAGAFDRVSHPGLLHKASRYGLSGALLAWLQDYLCDRRLQTTINGFTSSLYPISAGVPQGSILGPTLYLLYTNDAEDHLPAGVELAAYADDTTLYQSVHTIGDVPESARILQSAVDALAACGEGWKISFEPSKSQTLHISSSHREPWPTPALTFNDTIIAEQSSLQLLGVSFDSPLSYRRHIRNIAVRANQRLGQLKKASPFLDCSSRDRVYKAFVRPIMEYCPLAWMGAAETHLQQLNRVQRRALHIIGAGTWLPSLTHRRLVAACTLLYKLFYLPPLSPLRSLLPPKAPVPSQPTRLATSSIQGHSHQLETGLPIRSNSSSLRAFPACVVPIWNALPKSLLKDAPTAKKMQSFKVGVHKHLLRQNWFGQTDSL